MLPGLLIGEPPRERFRDVARGRSVVPAIATGEERLCAVLPPTGGPAGGRAPESQ